MFGVAPAQLTIGDTNDSVVIRPVPVHSGHPVTCRSYDLGAPEVREAVSPLMGLDGVSDSTMYTGTRTCTFDLVIRGDDGGSAYDYLERLIALTHPTRRPYLYMERSGITPDGAWRMPLRGNPYSISYARRAAALLEVSLAYSSPTGYFESPERNIGTGTAGPADTQLAFPTMFPATFGTSGNTPSVTFTVAGSAPIAPYLTLYGPATNPELLADDGTTFAFRALTLDADRYVIIDMENGLVNLNGDMTSSVYHLVDWSRSNWFRMKPGTRRITVRGYSGPLVVSWRDRRYTI